MIGNMNNNQTMSLGQYLGRALLWGLGAKILGIEDSNAIKVAVVAPVAERALGFTLEDIVAAMERERQKREREERLAQIGRALDSFRLQPVSTSAQPAAQLAPLLSPQLEPTTPLAAPLEIDKDGKWREVIVHPSIVLILGRRGSGKSALGYRLLEIFRYGLTTYVLAVPAEAQRILPDWVGIAQRLEDIPLKSIVLVDEAYLRYHSRESLKGASREMSRVVNLSRQRDQTLIFVTPEARQLDKNIASSANVVVFKDLGMLQIEFDRPEIAKIAAQAREAFLGITGDRRRWSYVYSPDANFMGLLENSLPSFWSTRLSRAFAGGGEASATTLPKTMTLEERIQRARQLHHGGLSLGQIAKTLRVSKGTAHNYVKGYPYKG